MEGPVVPKELDQIALVANVVLVASSAPPSLAAEMGRREMASVIVAAVGIEGTMASAQVFAEEASMERTWVQTFMERMVDTTATEASTVAEGRMGTWVALTSAGVASMVDIVVSAQVLVAARMEGTMASTLALAVVGMEGTWAALAFAIIVVASKVGTEASVPALAVAEEADREDIVASTQAFVTVVVVDMEDTLVAQVSVVEAGRVDTLAAIAGVLAPVWVAEDIVGTMA